MPLTEVSTRFDDLSSGATRWLAARIMETWESHLLRHPFSHVNKASPDFELADVNGGHSHHCRVLKTKNSRDLVFLRIRRIRSKLG